MSSTGKFACEGCGKSYSWKPELAGKKVRCKCGNVMVVPSVAPAHDSPPALDDMYELAGDKEEKARRTPQATDRGGLRCPSCQSDVEPGAVICLACGLNFKTGKKMQTTVGGPDVAPARSAPARTAPTRAMPVASGAGGAAAIAPGASPMLGYAGRTPAASSASAEALAGEMQNLKWPIVMTILGLLMGYGFWIWTGLSPAKAAIALPVALLIDMVLIIIGSLAAVKFMEISLGSPAEAILRLCAVALVPGYVASFINYTIPFGMFLSFFVSLGIIYVMLAWFFDLDTGEMMGMAGMITVVRCFAGMFLTIYLLGSFFDGTRVGGGGGSASGGMFASIMGGGDDIDTDTSTPAGKMNKRAQDWLNSINTEEGKKWLAGGNDRQIVNLNHDTSIKAVNDLYAAGAKVVHIANLTKYATMLQADKLIVEWPTDPAVRARILAVHAPYFKGKEAAEIQVDHGKEQKYLILDFDGNIDE